MADNKQQTTEQFSNELLKEVFQDLHLLVVDNINTSLVIDILFAARVISNNDVLELQCEKNPREKCRHLFMILHKLKNPRTFVELRQAIDHDTTYDWLIKKIDEKYQLMTSAAGQPEELNHVIDDLKSDNAELKKENSRLLEDNKRLKDDNERLCLERSTNDKKMANIIDELKKELESVRQSYKLNSFVTPKITKLDAATGVSETERKLTLVDPQKTARDNDVILKRPLHDNPQLSTLDQSPTDGNSRPRPVEGLVMLDKYLYVVYVDYNKVQVFNCEDRCKKIKDIEVKGMRPADMVGSSVTSQSQLFISDHGSDVIWRVDSKTGVSDVFVKTGSINSRLSLVENRLLVTSNELLMFDIVFVERIKKIPLTEVIKGPDYHVQHAIESNRDSFFLIHSQSSYRTVSEIDSEGRVIRVFDNKLQLVCERLALNTVGRLLAVDWKNCQVVLFDEHLKLERILIDNKKLDNARPLRLNYDKNNNKLTVGLGNGHFKIFEY